MPRGPRMGFGKGMMGGMWDPRSRFFMALANDQRLKILTLLREGEKKSSELIDALELDPSVVSRHLMFLRNTGMVQARKEGAQMFFSVTDQRVFQIIDLASEIIKDWLDIHRQFL